MKIFPDCKQNHQSQSKKYNSIKFLASDPTWGSELKRTNARMIVELQHFLFECVTLTAGLKPSP